MSQLPFTPSEPPQDTLPLLTLWSLINKWRNDPKFTEVEIQRAYHTALVWIKPQGTA